MAAEPDITELLQDAMASGTREERVTAELISRRAARQSLTHWARLNGYEPAAHHRMIIERLEQVARGEITRAMFFLPPRAAKSTFCSVLFPAWFLANNPTKSIICASHTTDLAERWGRRVRNLIMSHEPTLGIGLADDSAAAGRWALKQGGEYNACGVGQGIAGLGCHIAIIDDPVRSREDADSPLIQERMMDWYRSDLQTRLFPGSAIILIMTRWSCADLAGRLLEEMAQGGEQWSVLSLPAIAKVDDPLGRQPGEILWDNDPNYRYGDILRMQKATQPPEVFEAMYQQSPVPEGGGFFKLEWFKPYTELPAFETLAIYAASDFAVTEGSGDFTCHLVVGIAPDQKMYLIDLWRGRTTPDVWMEVMADLIVAYKPTYWALESGQIKSAVGPFLESYLKQRRAFTVLESFASKHNKEIRARSMQGRMSMHGLYVPTHRPWYGEFLAELLTFPHGRFDDQADTIGLCGQLIDKMIAGHRRQPAPLYQGRRVMVSPSRFPLGELYPLSDVSGRKRKMRV